MHSDVRTVVERLHASRERTVIAVSGAGSRAIAWLLGVPGASRTVLEVTVPYSSESLKEFLGYEPDQSVSSDTAKAMARAAYMRGVGLRRGDYPVIGLACTATITTDRIKRGEHRCHVAAWDEKGLTTLSLALVKGLRDRRSEEEVVSRLLLAALAEATQVDLDLSIGLDERECVRSHRVRYDDPVKALIAEHVTTAIVYPDGAIAADAPVPGAILPGSFSPLHEGHERLAEVASSILGVPTTFELSITNVDKPRLEEREIRKRVAQFAQKGPVVVTRALVFHQKAELFPGSTFVVGWDTAVRLMEPRYYGSVETKMLVALERVRQLGCRFLVAGRAEAGTFRGLEDVPVPEGLQDMFTSIPESTFRCDLTSTELRLAERKV